MLNKSSTLGGAIASNTGKRLERFVANILDDRDYEMVDNERFIPYQSLEQPIYASQFEIGKDIYGKIRRVDIILFHPRLFPDCLTIQCKWQASRGSVEEKYPYEVLSIQQNQYDTIIVLDGGGYSAGARQWLLNQAGKNRLKHVFDRDEFDRFASQGRFG